MKMPLHGSAPVAVLLLSALGFAQSEAIPATATRTDEVSPADRFHPPVRLAVGGATVKTEAPGYASPFVGDVTGDGHADLLVGQFADGKIAVYPGDAKGKFGERQWLEAAGKTVTLKDVW